MTKQEWIAIAEMLGALRLATEASWPPKSGYRSTAQDAHDRKLVYFAQLEMLDRVATVLAAMIDRMCNGFSLQRWIRLVHGKR